MPSLQIRELPERIYNKLRLEAKKEHRSFSQQAIVSLEKGLGMTENATQRRMTVVEKIMENAGTFQADGLADPADLVREDRER